MSAILSILFKIVYHWGNIINNPKEKHNTLLKRWFGFLDFKHTALELNTNTHQQPPAFVSIVNFTYIAAQES